MTVETVVSEIDEKRPRVLAFACASSVTGAVHDMARICRAARERGVLTCVDASQAAPHFGLNVPEIGCDFLTFSGHKLLAPTGIGVLTGKPDSLSALEPLMIGGGSIDRVTESGFTLKEVPYRLEAGTPNVSGALGLAAAVEFLERISLRTIGAHQAQLARTLYETLRSTPGIEMLMSSTEPRLALGSIAIPAGRVSPDDLAVALSDSYGIMVRSGFHCAHPLFDRFGHSHGALRASAYVYNTASDIEAFGEALRKLLRFFGV
jgi:cysteine desulfurase/selenocysteine lyase